MKKAKLLLTALCVGSVLSCTKESVLLNGSAPVEVILEAFSGEDDVETKTVRQSDGATWWADGDQISLFFGNGNNGGSCFTTATGGETASFSGTLNAFTAGGEGYAGETTYFWGVYPYSTSNTCDNNSVTLTIPSVQPGVAGTFGPGVNISVGRSENLKMGFYNVCSGFSFSVSTEGITELMFKANDYTPIVGDATIEFVKGKPAVTSLTNTSSVVYIFPEGATFEVGQKYYLEFIPTTLDGFTVTIFNNRGQEASYEYTSTRTFERGMFSSISNLDTRVGEWAERRNLTFADSNFKAYCVKNFDTDNDGEVSYDEAAVVKAIDYSYKSATSMDEIRFFSSLETLYCPGNKLTSLDVSNNIALTSLNCGNNQLTSLDVSDNTALTSLNCGTNRLISLDVSNNTALTDLFCSSNTLKDLDVSNNIALKTLLCDYNQLTRLDVSNNTALTTLWCSSNDLKDLDVNHNAALMTLLCRNNQLISLDVSNNTALVTLLCSPMNDEGGQNLLKALFIFNGQSINGITSYRDSYNIPDETVINFAYVEIGGKKWATRNLGAKTVAGNPSTCYGDYFAWGETKPRYKDFTIGDDENGNIVNWDSKYSQGYWNYPTYYGKSLDADHDAATQKIGSTWRTPTKEDFVALDIACGGLGYGQYYDEGLPLGTKSTTDKGIYWCEDYDGVKGVLFSDGINQLFFPAAGSFYHDMYLANREDGYYWSSSLSTYDTHALAFNFKSSFVNPEFFEERFVGMTIRPVSD